MTLPYPLLAWGKIIDTDMDDTIESLKERIFQYEENRRNSPIQLRVSALSFAHDLAFVCKTPEEMMAVFSRANAIEKYLLEGSTSVQEEADLRFKLLNGYEHIRQLLNDLGVPIPILESTSSVWEHTLHALVAYLEKCPPNAGK